ncbi:MAG: hypothetical protein HIU89_07200 [Proteobacteria bacterium]|nr:hypothetical protein [Pseudomonadota bacterium]
MARPVEYDNLVRTGSLKDAVSTQDSIAQFIRAAEQMLAAAQSGLPEAPRFTLSYEGMFDVVMAVLEHHETRPGDSGSHRATAIQRVAVDLQLEPSRISVLMRLHDTRNRVTYRSPIPPVTMADADAMLSILQSMLSATKELLNFAS